MSSEVACGVTSRGPSPVPPVVTTRSAPSTTAATIASEMRSWVSGTTSGPETWNFPRFSRSSSAGPLTSSRVPADTPSLTVMTCARWGNLALPGPRSPTRFFEQSHRFEVDAAFDSLGHVDQGEPGDSGCCERLHLDPRLADDPRPGGDAHTSIDEFEVNRHARERQRVAKRYQVRGLLRGHDAGHAGNLQRIPFRRPFPHRAHRFGLHTHHALRGCLAHSCNLVGDVDHPRGAFLVEVRKPFRHGHQDMRMPDTEAVLLDYGRTLVTFTYPTEDLLRVLREFQPRIEAALGVPAPEAQTILHDVLLPLEEYINSMSEDEVDYMDVYRDAWRRAGLRLPDELLHDILDAEQRCWDRAVQVDPDAPRVLS